MGLSSCLSVVHDSLRSHSWLRNTPGRVRSRCWRRKQIMKHVFWQRQWVKPRTAHAQQLINHAVAVGVKVLTCPHIACYVYVSRRFSWQKLYILRPLANTSMSPCTSHRRICEAASILCNSRHEDRFDTHRGALPL